MKRLFFLSAILLLGLSARAANSLSLSSGSGVPGSTVTLTVSLANTDSVASFRFSIPLNGNFTFVPGSCLLSSRSNGHSVSALVSGDSLHIQAASLHGLTGNSGAILTFQLVLGNVSGAKTLYLRQAALYAPDSTLLTSTASSGTVTIQAPRISASTTLDFGSCAILSQHTRTLTIRNSGNRTLTVSSITFDDTTLSCTRHNVTIYAGVSSTFTIYYNPTQPGTLNATATIHSNATAGDTVITITAAPYAVNELHVSDASGESDSTVRLYLSMNNMSSIVGLQTQVILPSLFRYVPNSFRVESHRSQGHTAMAALRGDTLTLLAFSMANLPFLGSDSTLCSFEVTLCGHGNFSIDLINTVLSDSIARNLASGNFSGTVTVFGPDIDSSATQFHMGSIPITLPATAPYQVVNTGSRPLVVSQVLFLSSHFSITDTLPLIVPAGQSVPLHLAYSQYDEGTFSTTMKIYSNDSVHALYNVALSVHRYTPNIFSIEAPDTLLRVDSAMVQFNLDNHTPITAVQFDFHYPHSQYILDHFATSLRSNGHYLTSARVNDSVTRVLLISLNNQPLTGSSGPILSALLRPTDSILLGSHNLSVSHVILSDAQGQNRLSILDSLATILVVPNPVDTLRYYPAICPGDYHLFFNDTLSVAGTYCHFVPGLRRDTLHILELTVLPTSATMLTQTACDSYFWHDSTYLASTTALYHTLNSVGCDSAVTLQLTVHYSTAGTDSYNLCDSLRWIDGNLYTASNSSATHLLTNAVGCDSLVTLQLTIRHSSTASVYDTACDSYSWFGNSYSLPTDTATHHLANAAGCDSLITLHLHLKYSTTNFETYTACDSFTWNGHTYTASVIDADTLVNAVGCDSLIGLQLFINYSYDTVDIQSACDSYTWNNGITYTTSVDTVRDSLLSIGGCDSLVTLQLTIRYSSAGTDSQEVCDSLLWMDGNLYTASTDQPTYVIENADGCDSLITLNLTVHYSSADTLSHTADGSYTWQGETYTASGSYTWSGTTTDGCDSTVTLLLTINQVGIDAVCQPLLELYPNPASDRVLLSSDQPISTLQLFDAAGRQLWSLDLHGASRHHFSTADLPAGTYLLHVTTPTSVSPLRLLKR